MSILDWTDPGFARYGRVLDGLAAAEAVAFAQENALPGEGVVYEPSVAGLEADEAFVQAVGRRVYGGMPVQVGWCYGRNVQLSGLEYHKGTEVLVAVTDVVLLLGRLDEVEADQRHPLEERATYDTSRVEAFLVPQGGVVELHPWCLHFAPCHVHAATGFRALIVLPQGTNMPLDFEPHKVGEAALLFARNKWLIVHPEAEPLVQRGAYVGLEGKNLQLQALE